MTQLKQIMVVDDEAQLTKALCDALNKQGYSAVGFTSVFDALQALEEKGTDILLMDLSMPQMNGIDFFKTARKIDPHVMGIIMTGYATQQNALEAIKVGAYDYVMKPFKISTLLPVIAEAIKAKHLLEENLQPESDFDPGKREEKKTAATTPSYTQMEQTIAFLNELSKGLVHEIAQPLNTIVLTTGGLIYANRGNSVKTVDLMHKIQKISLEADRIANALKQFGFLNSISRSGNPALCSINRTLTTIIDILSQQFSSQNIKIETTLADHLSPVWGDLSHLETMVTNLLVNAGEALASAGRKNKLLACSTREESGRVILEISDNASGIDNEIKEAIFEPFFTNKPGDRHLGLGLSVVRAVLINLNGQIEVRNNESGGATFTVLLPVLTD
ncbi:MAG: response regulator [Syntrophomonas sp.]